MSETCTYPIPDYVIAIFWVFVSVAMLAVIFAIISTILNTLIEHYQDRRAAYLRNKQTKLELQLYAQRKKDE